MAYSRIQLVAYEVPTLRVTAAGPDVGAVGAAPVPDGLSQDATYRLRRFARVANFARQRVLANFGNHMDTLKLFVAPEFYFRPNSGSNNSYTLDDATSIMQALRKMFLKAEWRDWLIVPGSVFWMEAQPKVGHVYWNSALLIQGGEGGATEYVDKTAISSIDGAPQDEGPDSHPYFKDYFNKSTRLKSIIDIAGIRFGIEICLDHGKRYLKQTCVEYQGEHGVDPSIGVHLLTACGMQKSDASVAAKRNGYFVRVDGVPNAIGVGWPHPRSELARVTATNFGNVSSTATTTDLTGGAGVVSLDIPAEYQTAASVADRGRYPERVVIQASQPL